MMEINPNTVDKTASCFSVRYQHQVRLFIECKTVVLRKLSIDFFEEIISEALS